MNDDADPTPEELAAWRQEQHARVRALAATVAAGYIAASDGDWSSDVRLAQRIVDLAEKIDDELCGRYDW